MELPDPKKLKNIYNYNFESDENNWASDSPQKALKVVKQILKRIKKRGYASVSGNKLTSLDIGSALGTYTNAFEELGYTSSGIDISDVAVTKATEKYPSCFFLCMDGFNPVLHEKFDLIFCKGFSGANTHDIGFVVEWMNRYTDFLKPGGFFVFSYTTNLKGIESEGETVNWTLKEIDSFIQRIGLQLISFYFFYYYGAISYFYKQLMKLFRSGKKQAFYIIFQK
jgi:SAM-dependent methyltransferase